MQLVNPENCVRWRYQEAIEDLFRSDVKCFLILSKSLEPGVVG